MQWIALFLDVNKYYFKIVIPVTKVIVSIAVLFNKK